MARYTAEQIYAFAREAGFSPDRAATMTAVALAESGGNSGAHNPRGEDSRGLWQINARAHPQLGQGELYDPLQNAKAAFAVSHGGGDISPWTTTHGGLSARYLRFRAQAEAAAAAYGDGPGRGMWSGTDGYGDHTSAGDARGGGQQSTSTASSGSDNVNVAQTATDPVPGAGTNAGEEFGIALDSDGAPQNMDGTATAHPGEEFGIAADGTTPDATPPTEAPAEAPAPAVAAAQPVSTADGTKLQQFLNVAVAQTGDQYVFGAETKLNDPNPSRFDCSELVEWASHQVGVKVPDGAWNQYTSLNNGGNTTSVEQALKTPGALLFSFSSDPLTGQPKHAHVAISLGNGKTIEAKGTEYGVGSWDANTRRFQYAAVIPGMGGPAPVTPGATPTGDDTFSHRVNHDPVQMDNHPGTLAVSHQLTDAAQPPGGPLPEPAPEPVFQTMNDVDHDGMDDALQHATEFAGAHDGHPLDTPGIDHVDHDFHDPAAH